MVGLRSSGGENDLRPLLFCVGKEVFQFSGLVASKAKAGQVVTLDIDVCAQKPADIFKPVDRRGKYAEGKLRKLLQFSH